MAATTALLVSGGAGAFAVLSSGSSPTAKTPPPAPTTTAPFTTTPARAVTVSLVRYGGCPQVLAGIKAEALREVGPYGLGPSAGYPMGYPAKAAGASVAPAAGAPAFSAGSSAHADAAASPASPAPLAYSTTNDQEVGVDEPDVAKTDGKLLVTIRHNPVGVEVASVGSGTPHLDGFLALPGATYSPELLLTGGDAVVIDQAPWSSGQGPTTSVTVVSLADPAHPSIVRTFELQGEQSGARLIAGRVIVVLQDQPHLPFVYPSDGSAGARAAALEHNRAAIRSSTLADWLPSVTVSPSGQTWAPACESAFHPSVASGLGTVSVVSIDPSSDQPGGQVTVVGDAQTVYASTSSLYVATTSWASQISPGSSPSTDIHGFDLSDPAHPRYIGSGTVPGNLIGQYAMSEYNGDLRVATTVGFASPPPFEGAPPVQLSDNRVTVLAPRDGELVQVGEVGGLGQGEKIYGVRFVGPLGYVVTFRQTDPLYVVDLSDPAHPVVKGSLQLTGFSSFLQPLGGSRLLGVGQSVDANYRQSGLQLSVFDVAVPASPLLLSRLQLPGASSSAQNDPHALLWWPARSLVVMPVNAYSPSGSFNGVFVWRVGTTGHLEELARIAQPGGPPPPCPDCAAESAPAGPGMMPVYYGGGLERAIVVGNLLYTVSDQGIMATDMTNWTQAGWLAFDGS